LYRDYEKTSRRNDHRTCSKPQQTTLHFNW
jgi:hypothetical protein